MAAILLQGLMVSGRQARIEIKDVGPQPPTGHPCLRCRMMLEGDDESVFELMSASVLIGEGPRLKEALVHLAENGVFAPSLQVIDSRRGFSAVMRRSAMRRLGLDG